MKLTLTIVIATGIAAPAAQGAGVSPAIKIPPGAVILSPGDDLQAAVNAHTGGTVFHLRAGAYRTQRIVARDADVFVGEPGTVFNGAKLLTEFDRKGALYVARHQPIDPDTEVHGVCRKHYPRCGYPQDLYFDGKPLRAVAKRAKVAPGTFFYDYDHEAVYFVDDPSGHTVELSYSPFAFGGKGRNVTVQNVMVEKYACADQQGAIGNHGEGKQWEILDDEVRWNHGVGIVMPQGSETFRNYVHHNGEMGLAAGAGSGALEDNEIAYKVWNGTDCNWECGGAKWAQVLEWFVLNNKVHDNQGDGFWADMDSEQMIFKNNDIENNLYAGISLEISTRIILDSNIFKANGAKTFNWGWNGQVQIQNSHGIEVENNTLVLDPRHGGNGIVIIQQNRGRKNMPSDNTIQDNDISAGRRRWRGGGLVRRLQAAPVCAEQSLRQQSLPRLRA
jgi:parallel beta-helix repeat protein